MIPPPNHYLLLEDLPASLRLGRRIRFCLYALDRLLLHPRHADLFPDRGTGHLGEKIPQVPYLDADDSRLSIRSCCDVDHRLDYGRLRRLGLIHFGFSRIPS